MKAKSAKDVRKFTDIPNIGKATEADFRLLGIATPADVAKQDPLKLYQKLQSTTGQAHDPCCLDTFMATVEFMADGPPKPWWEYTEKRKALLVSLDGDMYRAAEPQLAAAAAGRAKQAPGPSASTASAASRANATRAAKPSKAAAKVAEAESSKKGVQRKRDGDT